MRNSPPFAEKIHIMTPQICVYLASCAIVLVLALLAFVIFAEFTEKITVRGYVDVSSGVVKIYANEPGIVEKSFVQLGNTIQAGMPLFLIKNPYDPGSKHFESLQALQQQKKSITQSLQHKKAQLKDLSSLLDRHYIARQDFDLMQDAILSLRQQLQAINIEIINIKKYRSYILKAPVDGVVSLITLQTKQYVAAHKLLASILPIDANFLVQAYVPVRQSGFLQVNLDTQVAYDAYPYQKFGVATGKIIAINSSALLDADEEKPLNIGEPYYTVTIKLDKQFITVFGKQNFLRQGMSCAVRILGARKKLWQWIFEPILQEVRI
jgi:membrane fusion protein